MSILTLLIILGLLGLAGAAAKWLPIPNPFKTIIIVVLVAIAIWICLDAFGLLDQIRGAKVPRID